MNSANIKKIWNKINAIRDNRQNSQIKTLSQITTATDSNEIANILASISSQKIPASPTTTKNLERTNYLKKQVQSLKLMILVIRILILILKRELEEVLRNTPKNNSSPRPDNILNELIKQLPTIGHKTLLDLYILHVN